MTHWQTRQIVYFMESVEQRGGRVQISESLYHELKAKGCNVWVSGEGSGKKRKVSPLEDVTNLNKARNAKKRRAA